MESITTIQIEKTTRDELKRIGSMGNNYNDVIKMLIAEHNANKVIAYGDKYIEENKDKFVSLDEL